MRRASARDRHLSGCGEKPDLRDPGCWLRIDQGAGERGRGGGASEARGGRSPGTPAKGGNHCRPAVSRGGLEGVPPGWPCLVSWAGSIGDRHEGPQVASYIHRTAAVSRRPDRDRLPARLATGGPQITISKRNWSDLFACRWLRALDLNLGRISLVPEASCPAVEVS